MDQEFATVCYFSAAEAVEVPLYFSKLLLGAHIPKSRHSRYNITQSQQLVFEHLSGVRPCAGHSRDKDQQVRSLPLWSSVRRDKFYHWELPSRLDICL